MGFSWIALHRIVLHFACCSDENIHWLNSVLLFISTIYCILTQNASPLK